jgi:uncharacterized membrane protein
MNRMNMSPFVEYRPYLGRFLLFLALGALLGTIGFGLMLYFGVVLLLVGLSVILISRNAEARVSWWGLLCGTACGFFAAWQFLRATGGLRF